MTFILGMGVLFYSEDVDAPNAWVLSALQRGDSPATASDAKVARALDAGLHELLLAPFDIKCTTKWPKAISTVHQLPAMWL